VCGKLGPTLRSLCVSTITVWEAWSPVSLVHDSVQIAWCKTKKKTCLSVVTSGDLTAIMGRGNDFVEKRGSTSSRITPGSRRRYDANFKMMVINHVEVTNN
jgi:hypothetical protein